MNPRKQRILWLHYLEAEYHIEAAKWHLRAVESPLAGITNLLDKAGTMCQTESLERLIDHSDEPPDGGTANGSNPIHPPSLLPPPVPSSGDSDWGG